MGIPTAANARSLLLHVPDLLLRRPVRLHGHVVAAGFLHSLFVVPVDDDVIASINVVNNGQSANNVADLLSDVEVTAVALSPLLIVPLVDVVIAVVVQPVPVGVVVIVIVLDATFVVVVVVVASAAAPVTVDGKRTLPTNSPDAHNDKTHPGTSHE